MFDRLSDRFGDRADELRMIAEGMRDEGSRKLLLDLAEGYDRMEAERHARRGTLAAWTGGSRPRDN
ncbi:MAG: hypothetical protein ACM30I_02645 [Gemmatimonas sp.]